jgi:diguanylate cyclase (GGDEF)-like protein
MPAAAPHPRRSWIRFLRHALAGADLEPGDAGRALDLASAFCRWRAAALFHPSDAGGMRAVACSAGLRGEESALEAIGGPERDVSALAALEAGAPSRAWPLVDILDHPSLLSLRGLALRLESLSISIHAGESGRAADGFLLALWEEDEPAAAHLDRAQLTALALARPQGEIHASAGIQPSASLRPAAEEPRAARLRAPGDDGAASEVRRAQQSVLRELEALANEGRALEALQPHSRLLSDLDSAVAEAQRRRQPLALVLIDADDLAGVNDEHGPQAGDRLLQEIASILLEEVEQGDLVVRYGMEEFAVLAHGTPKEIQARARQIQLRVRQRALPGPSAAGRGSVSVGAACLPDPLTGDAATLRLKAEQALELARRERPGGLIIL